VKAYRIADNKLAELTEWNMDLLPLELADLQGLDVDLGLLGFDENELAKLLEGEIEDGEPGHLVSSTSGPAEILWKDAAGVYEPLWAVVRLGNRPSGGSGGVVAVSLADCFEVDAYGACDFRTPVPAFDPGALRFGLNTGSGPVDGCWLETGVFDQTTISTAVAGILPLPAAYTGGDLTFRVYAGMVGAAAADYARLGVTAARFLNDFDFGSSGVTEVLTVPEGTLDCNTLCQNAGDREVLDFTIPGDTLSAGSQLAFVLFADADDSSGPGGTYARLTVLGAQVLW
jgi:hypothetical protein